MGLERKRTMFIHTNQPLIKSFYTKKVPIFCRITDELALIRTFLRNGRNNNKLTSRAVSDFGRTTEKNFCKKPALNHPYIFHLRYARFRVTFHSEFTNITLGLYYIPYETMCNIPAPDFSFHKTGMEEICGWNKIRWSKFMFRTLNS